VQTKITIEMIVDYRNKDKLEPFITAAKRAAARLNAAGQLLKDEQPVQVILYSDDFFVGRTDLEYLFEEIEQEQPTKVEPPMSDEFLKALKGE
jgi:hypothetical protein